MRQFFDKQRGSTCGNFCLPTLGGQLAATGGQYCGIIHFHNGGHKNYNDWALKELNKAIRDNGDNAYEGAVKFSEKARDEVDYAVKYLKDATEELTIDQYWVKYVLKGKRPPLP